jgi:pilus assembly protein FimV
MHLITHTSYRLKQLSAAVMLACLLPAGAYAATLGKLTVLSAIGQPLNAEIELLSVGAQEKQSLAVKLAPQQAFSQASVEYNPALGALQFAIETRGAVQVVHITSADGFNEPAVDVLLELSGANTPRAVREYSFLLDPPKSAQSNAAQVKADPKPVPAAAATAAAKPDAKAEPKAEPKTDARADAKAAKKSAAKSAAKTADADAKPKSKAGSKSGSGKSEYKVKQGDSLSAIANRMRPAGVSLDQMLVAMYRANPDAFIGDNMSRMRAGAVLSVPDAATANAVERSDANSIVVAQAQDFNTYRNQLAGHIASGAAKKGGAPAQAASGKITAKVEERATPAGQAKDKLQLSKAGAGDGMTSEDKIASDKAASEAESRIKDLEKNVNDLQKLLEIKNQNLAALNLQKNEKVAPAAAATPAATAPAPATAAAATPAATAVTPAAAVPATATTPETPAATPAPADPAAETPAPAATTAADVTTPAATDALPAPAADTAAPAKPKPVLSPPVPKPDFFDGWRENPMLLPGGGLLALVLLAWAAYRARRNQIVEPGDAAAVDGAPVVPVAPVAPEAVAIVPVVEPEPEPEIVPVAEPEPVVAAAPEEVFVPPVEEPVIDAAPVADPLFASDETAALAAAQAELAEQQAKRDAEDALKIDLGRLEEPAESPFASAAAPALDMSKLDFDLELDQNLPPPVEDAALDIDLAAELAAQQEVAPYVVPVAKEAPAIDVAAAASDKPAILPPAIEGLSLDLSDPEPAAAARGEVVSDADASAAAASAALAGLPESAEAVEEDEDETSSFAKEINTKLDLAAAYQEIGDKDGARELLDEVTKSGNRRQVGKAQEMLEQLS